MAEYRGIDVSALGGVVDFREVKAAGYSFAILRAAPGGYSGLIEKIKGGGARFDERSG